MGYGEGLEVSQLQKYFVLKGISQDLESHSALQLLEVIEGTMQPALFERVPLHRRLALGFRVQLD